MKKIDEMIDQGLMTNIKETLQKLENEELNLEKEDKISMIVYLKKNLMKSNMNDKINNFKNKIRG